MSDIRNKSNALRKEFKEDQVDNPAQLLNQKQLNKPKNQIELLEIFVEQAQSMTIGQRLVWHLNQQEKLLTLPHLPQSDNFMMRAINAKFHDPLKILNGMSEQVESKHKEYQDMEKMRESNIAQYSKESNTVFYYDKYKVLILLDFSKSTSNIYANQSKTYLDKMKESISIFIYNLMFRLENKYAKKPTNLNPTEDQSYRPRKSSHHDERIQPNSKIQINPDQEIQEIPLEEQSDQSPINSPKKRIQDSSTFKTRRQNIDGKEIKQNSDDKKNIKAKKGAKKNDPQYFEPTIYLTIAASGLPQMNQMRLLIHNQKVEDLTINEVMNSLDSKLQLIEDYLADNYNIASDDEKQEEYLQKHLYNGVNLLNLMTPEAKPLMVLMTDATNSLFGRFQNGRIDPLIQKLHQNDTKIITVNLGEENKVANSFGFVNHVEHLKYLAYVTRGVHFEYSQLTKLVAIFNYMEAMRPRLMSTSYHNRSNKKENSKLSKINIKKSKFSQELTWALSGKVNQLKAISSSPQQMINYSLFNKKIGLQADLSEQDKDHPYLNSLQKVMYARPCSYSKFLQTSEIQELVNYEERLIFENRISNDLVRKLRKDRDLFVNTSFSAHELIMNNMYMPIFRKDKLSDYFIKSKNLTALCHSKSKMCFQFTKINFQNESQEIQGNSMKNSRKPSSSSQNESGGTNNQYFGPKSKKVHYHHWWSNQILILCSLHQIESKLIHVKYKIVAQEEVIQQLRVENGQKKLSSQAQLQLIDMQLNIDRESAQNDQSQSQQHFTLLEQLNNFISYLQKIDKQHTLFEYLMNQVDKGYEHIIKRQGSVPEKYRQNDFDQIYHSFTDSSQQKSSEDKNSQEEIKQPKLNSKQNSVERFNQIKERPKYHQNSDKPFQQIKLKDEKRESSQISLQPRRSLHKKRSGLNDNSMQSNSQLRTQVPLNKKLQEPEFKDLLFKSKKHWQKLAKIPLTQWPQLFYTTKLDLLTNSNFKFDEIINLCSQMENKYNPDFQISKVVHEIMMKLTTFTIESTGGLYLQIFRENQEEVNVQSIDNKRKSINRFKNTLRNRSLSKNKTGLAANITSVIPNNESSGSGKEKQDIKKTTLKENIQRADITNNIYDYGFCLIRVEWAAANVAVFHFGFYQVSYKTIQSFLENFNQQSQELNQQRIDKYKKLLFDEQQDQKNKYFNVNDYHFFDKNLSQLLIPDENYQFNFQVCSHKSNNDSDQSTRDYINRSSLNDDELHSSKDQQQNLNNSQNNSNTQNQSTTRRENLLENKKQQSLEELISSHSTAKKIFKNTFDQQKSISYHKNWVWRNENRNTNKDFFEVIMKQRIKEGFYFVNRGCDNGKYLFIKALPAYKVKLTKKNQQKNSDSYYENDRANELNDQQPDTQILIQYVMYFDKDFEANHNGQSCFKTEIYMEQESAYFYFQKQVQQTTSTFQSQTNSNTASFFLQPGQNQNLVNDLRASNISTSNYNKNTGENTGRSSTIGQGSKNEGISCLSDKNFFYELYEYLQSVDSFLFNNICTYHNIVKNSVLKLINSPEPQLIKGEVCYFRNLIVQKVKQRRRLKLELAIRHKMQLLKRDWKEYLKNEYPELFLNQIDELEVINESSTHNNKNSIEQNDRGNSDSGIKNRKNSQFIQNERVMEEASFVVQIEELLENSKLIKIEQFDVPQIIFLRKQENLREMLSKFYDSLIKVIEEFCDFRIQNFSNEKLSEKYNFYAKLVTKQILFLVKMPSKQEFLNSILSNRNTGRMSIEFFRLSKKMIKISSKLTKNRVLYFLNKNFQSEQSQNESVNSKIKLKSDKQKKTEKYFNTEDEIPKVVPMFDQEDSDDDENINQIDQLFDFIFYYETSIKNNNNNLSFEPNVRTIINNFCSYLKTNYETIFADTVLMCLQDEVEKHQVMFGSDETKKNPLKTFEEDFERIKPTMTQCRFRMDISFLTLLINTLRKQGLIPDNNEESSKRFSNALDDIFHNLIRRNFQQFDIDPEFFIFKHNQLDKALVRELSTPIKGEKRSPLNFNQEEITLVDSSNYQVDLLGTKDSYSDSEDSTESFRKPNKDNQQIMGAQEIYNSCKKLLFKVNLVIKNQLGKKIVDEQLENISSIFDKYGPQIEETCSDLVEKVKFIEEEKMIAAKNNDAILRGLRMMYEMRDQSQQINLEAHNSNQVQAGDIESSVELYFSFYTIPQYVGIIRDQDRDFLCQEKDEILVNDDDHEDLIRVAKLMDYLGYGYNSQRRLANEDISFQDLFKAFNKKQLVKSIPYYFKRTQEGTENLIEKDYTVYFFDEIQRKIIYGILRRTYALVAQNLLENAALIRPLDPLNLILVQKYMGSLLFNQRQLLKVVVLSGLGNKQKQAVQILKEDLKHSQILNSICINFKDSDVYLLKTTFNLTNFYLKHQLEDGYLIPFLQNLSEERTSSIINDSNDPQSPFFKAKPNIKNEKFDIPFWLMFQIQESDDNGGEIRLNVTYHLPLYKSHSQLNNQLVENELNRTIQLISKRIKVILLLQQVSEFRFMPKNFQLNERFFRRDTLVSTIGNTQKVGDYKTYQMIQNQQTQNRMENAKNMMNEVNRMDQIQSPMITKQSNPAIKQSQEKPQATAGSKPSGITSKFRHRMEKYSKLKAGNTTDDNQSDSNVVAEKTIDLVEPPKQEEVPVPKIPAQEVFKVNIMYEHTFNLRHSSVKLEEALSQIALQARMYHPVQDSINLYVTSINSNIYLMKLTSKLNQEVPTRKGAQGLSQLRSFSNQNHTIEMTNNTIINDNSTTPHQSSQMKQSEYSYHQNFNQQSFKQGFQNYSCNQIIMELYGAYQLTSEQVEPLIQTIDNILKKFTINVIAQNTQFTAGQLSKDDFNYLEEADQKLVLLFPISESIQDRYAMLRFLKQNMSRYLYQVTFKSDFHNQTSFNYQSLADEKLQTTNSMMNQSHGNLHISKQDSYGNKKIGVNSISTNEFQRINRQSSISSGDETILSFRNDPASLIQKQRSNNLSRSQNIDFQSSTQDELIRLENDDDEKSESSSEIKNSQQNKDPKIIYKNEDFLLLYNFKMSLNKQSKNSQAQKDKIRDQNIQQIFNEALALISFGVLNNFEDPSLMPKQSSLNIVQSQQLSLEKLMQEMEQEFSTQQCFKESYANQDLTIYGMKYDNYQLNPQDNKQKIQLPLIYRTKKDGTIQSNTQESMIQQGQRLHLINNEFAVPLPNSQKTKWLMIKLNVIGELSEERFIQNLILNVNQSFNEVLMEHQLRKLFKPIPQKISNQEDNESLKNLQQIELQKEKGKPEKRKTDRSQFCQSIDNLKNMISQGKNAFTMIVHEFEKLIYGDSNDLFISLIFSMITHYHQEFRNLNLKQKLYDEYLKDEYGIAIIIELENKWNKKIDKTIILNVSVELQPQNYDQVYKELKFYLSRTQTVLKNIHPKLQLVIGSIALKQDIFAQEDQNDKLIIKIFKDPVLQLDNLRAEPEKIQDNSIAIKGYTDIKAAVQTTLHNKESSKVLYKRNFMIIVTLQDSKLDYKSFNLDKKTLKLNINMIQNHLQWHSNRQDYFKKIVSQKLGTVYTLKDFYSSSYFIKEQNIKQILNAEKFTFEERAKTIEGKQVYQFKKLKSKTRMRSRIRGHQKIERVESDQKECENIADEYLKFIEQSQDALRVLYKTISCRTVNQEKINVVNERIIPQQELRRPTMINPRANLHRANQKFPDKVFQEDEKEIKDLDQVKRKTNTKPVIQFKELIKNKSIIEQIMKNSSKIELHLTNLYTVSPGLSPCRIDYVICEKEKLISKYRQKQANLQLTRSSFDDGVCKSLLNDKILLNNPLYYHGTKVYRMMAGFYNKIQNAKKTSIVYKQSEASKSQVEKSTSSNKLQMFQDQLKEFISVVNQCKNRNSDLVPLIKRLVSQSRLLFSNTTILLFDQQNPQIQQQPNDDFEMSFNNLNDDKFGKKKAKSKILHSNTEIIQDQNPLVSKAFMEEIKNQFFDNYTQFLIQKANVIIVHQSKQEQTQFTPQTTTNFKGKRNITYQNLNQEFGSTNSIRKQVYLEDNQNKFKSRIPRSKKISDDYSSIENYTNEKILEVKSNSSFIASQQHKDYSQINFLNKRNMDRVLYHYQFQDHSEKNNQHSFIVKVKDDAMYIYELTFKSGLIRINVFALYEILNMFPSQILLNHQMLNQKYLGSQRKRDLAKEELRLSTKLNTDSFNYDFHSTTIMNMILFPEKKMKDVDPTQQISNLVSFYKQPPKYAKNYLDTIILRIDLGYLNNISDLEFLSYFSSKVEKYGLKIFNLKQIAQQQNLHATMIGNSVKRLTSEITYDASRLIFYKYQQQSQPLSKQIMYSQPINQKSQQKQPKYQDNTMKNKLQSKLSDKQYLEEEKDDNKQGNLSGTNQSLQNNLNLTPQQSAKNKLIQSKIQKNKESLIKQQTSDQSLTIKQQKNIKNQQRLQNMESEKMQSFKKLFLVEMLNKPIQGTYSSNTQGKASQLGEEIFKKVWNMECKKQELSVSQINMDNYYDKDNGDSQNEQNRDMKTTLELAFYYICAEDVINQQQTQGDIKIKKNTERYPIRELSIDMYSFINQLENAFNECRKDLIKDQLWLKFFDPTKDLQLTDIQIGDMLRFSYSYDLKFVDERYREVLQLKTYTQSFCEFIKGMFPNSFYKYNKQLQFKSGINKRENLLIYDKNFQHFLIHLDFNYEEREVQCFIVRKEDNQKDSYNTGYFQTSGMPSSSRYHYQQNDNYEQSNDFTGMSGMETQSMRSQKYHNQIILEQDEKQIVKKLINLFAYWLYKTSV